MYKKIEEYEWCNIYKHINAGIYIASFGRQKLAQGSYLDVKKSIMDFWAEIYSCCARV